MQCMQHNAVCLEFWPKNGVRNVFLYIYSQNYSSEHEKIDFMPEYCFNYKIG